MCPINSGQYTCDSDERSLDLLKGKFAAIGRAVTVKKADLQERPEDEASLDAINMTHCLYTQGGEGAPRTLARAAAMLNPGGYLVVADIGRVLDMNDWTPVIRRHVVDQHGWLYALKLHLKMGAVRRENRKVERTQRQGGFYLHTPEEFRRDLETAGFEVVSLRSDLYRGIDDFAVARKPD